MSKAGILIGNDVFALLLKWTTTIFQIISCRFHIRPIRSLFPNWWKFQNIYLNVHTHAFEYYQEQIPVRNVTRLKVGKQGILQIHNNCLTDANKRGYIDKSRYLMLSCGAMGHQLMVNGKQAQWKGNLYESQGQQVRRRELIPDQFLVNFGHTYRNLKTNLTCLLCTISSLTHSLPHHHIWFFFLFCLFSLSYLILIPFQHSFSISPPLSLFWFLFLFPQPLCCHQVSYIFFRICLFSLSYLLLIPFSIASLWCHHAVTPIIFSVAISLSFSHLQQPNSIYSHFQLHLIDAIHIYPCICLSDNYQTEKFLPQFTQSFSCRTLSSCTSNLH